ncbi:MAG: hypothetical protein ABIJ84_01145 [bacterium]
MNKKMSRQNRGSSIAKLSGPKSLRKFIRTEKARIRRQVLDTKKQEEEIKKIYERFGDKRI